MKLTIATYAALSLIVGCSALQQPPADVALPSQPLIMRSQAAEAEQQLLAKANQLADKVKIGQLTRTSAVDRLNTYRIHIVGKNPVDDTNFAAYRYVTAERDAARMTQEEARARMEITLRECSRQWAKLKTKTAKPIFTNFLMKMYGLAPLPY